MQPMQRVASAVAGLVVLYILATRYGSSSAETTSPVKGGGGDASPGEPIYRKRLVAIGDLHGDIEHARKILHLAGIIDQQGDWSGQDDILVQTGDIVDRGTYAWDIYRMMQTLRGQASAAGGQVVSVLGNHEVMNAMGDWRYVTPEDIKHTGGYEQRIHDMSTEGWLGQEWLANTTALVPMHPSPNTPSYSFTHGSLRPSFAHLTPYPTRINELGHSLLTKALTPPVAKPYPPNPYPGLPEGATPAEEALYDSGGPYWWRGLAEGKEGTVCKWSQQLQSKIGARRIIGGHTPNFEKIVDRCNASIIIIDTGMSRAYGGVLSALEIVYELHPSAHDSRGSDHRQEPFSVNHTAHTMSPEKRYREKEVVTAIYEKKRKVLAHVEQEITL